MLARVASKDSQVKCFSNVHVNLAFEHVNVVVVSDYKMLLSRVHPASTIQIRRFLILMLKLTKSGSARVVRAGARVRGLLECTK